VKHYDSVPSCYDHKSVGSAGIKNLITTHPTVWFYSKFLNSFQMNAVENYSGALVETTFFYKFLSVI
jgi:hypothetical protein